MKAPLALKKRMNSRWVGKLLIVAIVVSVSGVSIAFWVIGKRVERSLAEQMLHRQQIVARAGAMSIENFLEFVGTSLSSHAQTEAVIGQSDEVQLELNKLVKEWVDTPLVSVALTDKDGRVIFSESKEDPSALGVLLSERDYFKQALAEGEAGRVFVGAPVIEKFGTVNAKPLVPVAAAVYEGDEFKGVLIATIVFSELTKTYIDPLKISEETRLYLIDSSGKMLYAPYEKFIGVNYFDYLASVDFKGKEYAVEQLWKAVTTPEEGKIDFFLPNEVTGKLERFLISHSPINYQGEKNWTLIVASPMNSALVFFPQFLSHQVGVLIFAIFVVLALSAIAILAIRFAQREAFYEGFTRGREHAYRRKKGEKKETRKSK